MKRLIFFLLLTSLFSTTNAQYSIFWNGKEYHVTKTSLIKDTTGKTYDYNAVLYELSTYEFELRPVDTRNVIKGFWLMKLSPEEMKRRIESSPMPAETPVFKTGKKFPVLVANDMNGNTFDTEKLRGKVIVINFWFTNCLPCRFERPYLNKIVGEYKEDKNVVFLALALDPKPYVVEFLKENPFDYNILPDGNDLAKKFKISGYPTHVIVDKQGKVAFHTVGYTAVTGHWMRKTIDHLKAE